MKKKLAKLLVLLLIASMLLPGSTMAAESRTMRIGLNYGSNCVVVGNLRNVALTGYRFGYYDEQRSFVPLGQTGETKISVMITQNLYLTSGGIYVYDSANAAGAVGCYHVQMPGTYGDFASAQAAADAWEGGFVAWVAGTYYVRVGSYTRYAEAEAAAAALGIEGASVGETSGYGYSAVATGTTRILFQFDAAQAGEAGAFGVQPGLESEGKAVTEFKGEQYYGGFRFERINGGESTVVNVVDIDDYIKGVIPYEMSPSWPLEALKAQAVAARSYGLYQLQFTDHSKQYHFDLCNTTDCQVYYGVKRANNVTNQAVDETAGQLAYYNGRPISAVYSSSHGGGSEDSKNVWGTENAYLKGILDPYEEYAAAEMNKSQLSYYQWTMTYTPESLKARLHAKGYQCADIVDFTVSKYSPTGNAIEIKILDANGKTWTFSRAKVREMLMTNSIHFTLTTTGGAASGGGYAIAGEARPVSELSGCYAISADGTVSAVAGDAYAITASGVEKLEPMPETTDTSGGSVTYTLNGKGWGHNVGMSQWGAYAMAKQGMSYLDILHFYYTDITVE